jgi:hypothetical protein
MAKMTIIDERKIITTSAEEVGCGEIFNFEGEYFIMTDDMDEIIAVNLENGERRVFRHNDEVMPVNASLTIS